MELPTNIPFAVSKDICARYASMNAASRLKIHTRKTFHTRHENSHFKINKKIRKKNPSGSVFIDVDLSIAIETNEDVERLDARKLESSKHARNTPKVKKEFEEYIGA